MFKPAGSACNLDCSYCFYLEKEKLYERGTRFRMTHETLDRFVRSYIDSHPADSPVVFAWQGGEPTLMGIDFYRSAVALQKQYGAGRVIENAFQTNGTLLDDDWGAFLKENNFLVGVSIDGPRAIHDRYRLDKRSQPTWAAVMRGIDVLRKHRVEFNTLTCVTRDSAQKPLELYRFLRGIGSTHLQFIPIVERRPDARARVWQLSLASPPDAAHGGDPRVTPWSVRPGDYGRFLIEIFDRWVRHDVGRIHIQLFDTALGKWLGLPGGICVHAETCGRALAVEHNGDVYSCDHYVYPDHRLGNLTTDTLPALVDSDRQRAFGQAKRDTLPRHCRECPVLFACNGGCPKQRFARTPEGEPGLHYLCESYRAFFTHIDNPMRVMARLYRAGRAPSEVMSLLG
ncbi:MAG: anaerobic sulfatase maturase [Opitutaceae bacterium]|nr:anaerobic sulfatase maturase [Opitutaceae bacterium]